MRNFLLILCVLFSAKNVFASSEEAFRKGNFDAAFAKLILQMWLKKTLLPPTSLYLEGYILKGW